MLLYASNRWLLKPHLGAGFMRNHFNDLLLIPAALPLVLWLQSILGWRARHQPPTWKETVLHLVLWTVICEVVGPRFVRHATADWRDALAYLAGALVAMGWWRWQESRDAGARQMAEA